MKNILIVVILAVVAAAGWYFVSPLFIDEVVDEAFDLGNLPTPADIDAMDEAKKSAVMDQIMSDAAAMPVKTMDEPMEETPALLKQGVFVDGDRIHKGSGDAKIYQIAEQQHLLRLENLQVTNGPALVVYLAKHPDPKTPEDVKSGGFLDLGKLKGNAGNQNYAIPGDTDVSEFNSVVIWCELFDVLFSPAALTGV